MVAGFRAEHHRDICRNRRLYHIMRKPMAALFLLITGIVSTGWAQDQAADDFDKAYLLMASEAYLPALQVYNDIIHSSNHFHDQARALFLSGVIHHFYLNQTDQALCLFNKVLNNYPLSPSAEDALFHTGVIYKEQEKNEAARKTFLSYIKKYPQGIRKPSAELWYNSILRRINEPIALNDISHIKENTIRVLVAGDEKELIFNSKGSLTVLDMDAGSSVYQGAGTAKFSQKNHRLVLNHRPLSGRRFWVTTDGDALKLNEHPYRGAYMVYMTSDKLQAVNHVSLNHYLYGIISREMPYTWDADALMAQAVASRTYALYLKKQHGHLFYDVAATAACQVYGGIDAERESTNRAVDVTRGLVLTYHDRLVAAYFHANSAGHTEDAKNIWDVDMPYLKGIPDKFSKNLPFENWECYLSYEEIAGGLARAGHMLERVFAIRTKSVTDNGRILKIEVLSDRGAVEISGGHFRHCLDPIRVKSTKFRIAEASLGVFLQGKGAGHGVGMSQWGAHQMARSGFHYTKILAHYYPGTVVTKVDI